MAKLLIQITSGPNDPNKAILGFLIAKTAIESDHDVNLFLLGDAVYLSEESIIETLNSLGTGSLKEHYNDIINKGFIINLSSMSCDGRGITDDKILNRPFKKCFPKDFLELSLNADKILSF